MSRFPKPSHDSVSGVKDTTAPSAFAPNRRDCLRAAGGLTAALAATAAVHGQTPSTELIRVGLIGCGGRGTGALQQALSVNGSNVKVTAMADTFEDRVAGAIKSVEKMEGKVEVPENRRFIGLDAYEKVIGLEDIDLVILATPPGFRPYHFEAAIKAGKHVFMEKPVCVDSFGARLCLEVAKLADEKNLKVVVGLQRHYDSVYRATRAKIQEGLAGDIIGGQVYWNGSGIWYRPRTPKMSEMEFQVHNWYHFNWLCGDHICEQHVHNIDVANWFLGPDEKAGYHPLTAYGIGGRQQRVKGQPSEIYDHHTVDFTYPNGVRIASQCRQFPGGNDRVNEEFQGTKGIVRIGEITDHSGKVLWKYDGPKPNAYQVEHDELQDAIRTGKPLNNAYYGTHSSFSAVLGRLATYSGKQQDYEKALQMDYRTMPESMSWDATPPVMPTADGDYPFPMPATFKLPEVRKA